MRRLASTSPRQARTPRRWRLPGARSVVVSIVIGVAVFASIASSRIDGEVHAGVSFVATFDEMKRASADAKLRVCASSEVHDLILSGRLEATRVDLRQFTLPYILTDASAEITSGTVGLEQNVLMTLDWADMEHGLADPTADAGFCTPWLSLSMGPLIGDSSGVARWTIHAEAILADVRDSPGSLRIELERMQGDP